MKFDVDLQMIFWIWMTKFGVGTSILFQLKGAVYSGGHVSSRWEIFHQWIWGAFHESWLLNIISSKSILWMICRVNLTIYIYIIHFCAFLFTKISYIFQSRIYNKIPDRTSNVILESVVAYLPNGTFYSICNIPLSITMDSVLFGYISDVRRPNYDSCDGELTNFEQTRFVCLPIVCNTFQPTLIISSW